METPRALPPTTGFKSNTRPDTSQTNKTLRNAALHTLSLPKNMGESDEDRGCLSERTAFQESLSLKKSLNPTSPGSARVKQPNYASLGEYRPPLQAVAKPAAASNIEFQQMLAMIGEKVRQKFSKARDVFRFIDSDHSGSISRSEVHFFFRFFNVDAIQADKFFDGFEVDEEGEIAYVEFVKYLWPHVNPGNEQMHWSLAKDANANNERALLPNRIFTRKGLGEEPELELPRDLVRARNNIAQRLELRYKTSRDAFRDLDIDRDGTVTLEEMSAFLDNFGWGHTAERFWNILDARGHGSIEFRTFTGLFATCKASDFRQRL